MLAQIYTHINLHEDNWYCTLERVSLGTRHSLKRQLSERK